MIAWSEDQHTHDTFAERLGECSSVHHVCLCRKWDVLPNQGFDGVYTDKVECLTSRNHACSKASGRESSRSRSARCDTPHTWHTSHARTVHWRAGGSGPRWETRTLHTPHLLPRALAEENRTGVSWQDTNKCAMRDSRHTHYSTDINMERLRNDKWKIRVSP